jgi:hypothetical protein
MTFVLLIYRTTPASVALPPLEQRAALDGHRAVQADASARGELHAVARLDDGRASRVVRRAPDGGAHEVTDGPFIETKEWLVGFYLLDCADEGAAVERARALCVDAAHAIEVRPVTWRRGP